VSAAQATKQNFLQIGMERVNRKMIGSALHVKKNRNIRKRGKKNQHHQEIKKLTKN